MNQYTFASAIVQTYLVRDHQRRTKFDWEYRVFERINWNLLRSVIVFDFFPYQSAVKELRKNENKT